MTQSPRFGGESEWCRFIEIRSIQPYISAQKQYPPYAIQQPWSQEHMTEDQSCRPVLVDEMRAGFLKLAKKNDGIAAVHEEQARLYEEAGITGIHPSADTLRASAQSARRAAKQHRESAAMLT